MSAVSSARNLPGRIPIGYLLHPVGIGGTRQMNVASAKMWLRALVDLLPDIVIAAPWIPYAEVNIDRERGLRDALMMMDGADAAIAVGGEFSRGMIIEWNHARSSKLALVDLTRAPLPGILTPETFGEMRSEATREAVVTEFRRAFAMRAAA